MCHTTSHWFYCALAMAAAVLHARRPRALETWGTRSTGYLAAPPHSAAAAPEAEAEAEAAAAAEPDANWQPTPHTPGVWLAPPATWAAAVIFGLGGFLQGLVVLELLVIGGLAGLPFLPPTTWAYGLVWQLPHWFTWLLCLATGTQHAKWLTYLTFVLVLLQAVVDGTLLVVLLVGMVVDPGTALLSSPTTLVGFVFTLILALCSAVTLFALVQLVQLFPLALSRTARRAARDAPERHGPAWLPVPGTRASWDVPPASWMRTLVFFFGGLLALLFFVLVVVVAIAGGVPWVPPTPPPLSYGLVLSVTHFLAWLPCLLVATRPGKGTLWLTFLLMTVQALIDAGVYAGLLAGMFLQASATLATTPAPVFGAAATAILLALSAAAWFPLLRLARLFSLNDEGVRYVPPPPPTDAAGDTDGEVELKEI